MRVNKEKEEYLSKVRLEECPVVRGKKWNHLTLKKTEVGRSERLELAYSWFQERANHQKVCCFRKVRVIRTEKRLLSRCGLVGILPSIYIFKKQF